MPPALSLPFRLSSSIGYGAARGTIDEEAAVGSQRIFVLVICHVMFPAAIGWRGRGRLMISITARAPAKSQVRALRGAPPHGGKCDCYGPTAL